MDGNGRWAKRRGLPRTFGHRAGVKALKRTVEAAPDLGIEWLTVFGFSTENWSRPAPEVSELMGLLKTYVKSDLDRLEREGVRVHVIGRRDGLTDDILEIIERAETRTARQQPLPPAGRLQLRRAGGHRRRRSALCPGACHAGAARSGARRGQGGEDEEALRPRSVHRPGARGGPDHPHVGRAAAVQLPAVGSRLRRAGVPGRALAGLWAGAARRRRGGVRARERRYGGAEVDDVLAAG